MVCKVRLKLFLSSYFTGPIYRLCIVGINRVAVGNVELFGELCDERRFVKSVSGPLSQMRNLAHDGLVTAHPNENNWDIAHRIILPAFGHSHIQDMYHGNCFTPLPTAGVYLMEMQKSMISPHSSFSNGPVKALPNQ